MDILKKHVVSFAPYNGDTIFVRIDTKVWPGNSPDLNPIENVCNMLCRRLLQFSNNDFDAQEFLARVLKHGMLTRHKICNFEHEVETSVTKQFNNELVFNYFRV